MKQNQSERWAQVVARTLAESGLEPQPEHDCPYLPGRRARQLVIWPSALPPGLYHALLDLNFRRSGPIVYRPACAGCQECRTLRVLVDEFRPDRAQRRCLAKNADVKLRVDWPAPTAEKYALYRSYLAARHDGQMSGSEEEFDSFLYDPPPFALELVYRVEGRLLGVGIADLEPRALSAVYCYFDPEAGARSPGVLNVLTLIEECRRRGLPYLYLGYWVPGSPQMAYKARYRPHEVLEPDGSWTRRDRGTRISGHDRS
jgi:arginyl-tRNA--protein-N-Asp/Glu arginylyltransferase